MIVLVCGGREYNDEDKLYSVLDIIHKERGITHLIHGDARGADTLASNWAYDNKITCTAYPADWDRYGKYAGPVRNKRMLEEGKPNLVVAFHGGRGTANMIKLAKQADVEVFIDA